jgi:hypothetical protein
MEDLPDPGRAASDQIAKQRYLADVQRGKSLMQLVATAADMTPQIRHAWSPQSFTPVRTPQGVFDAVTCNVSYHFHKHGQRYGSIAKMTEEAQRYFRTNRHLARLDKGMLRFPDNSLYLPSGQIVTFVGGG